jgi:hypothetical protein
MAKKAELISKEVILLTKQNNKIVIERFNECYLLNGKLSVRKQNLRFYCNENQDYWATSHYCLITNLSKKQEGLKAFINEIKNKIKSDICIHLGMLDRFNRKLECYESIDTYSFFN